MLLLLIVVDLLFGWLACRVTVRRGYSLALGVGLAFVSPWTGALLAAMFPPPFDLFAILFARFGWLLPFFLPPTAAASQRYQVEAATEQQLQSDSQLVSCPACGRRNSVRTRVCPRCERHVFDDERRVA
jgi:hypothetical protein